MAEAPGSRPSTRRSRRSIATMPTSSDLFDKENNTIHEIGNHESSRKTTAKKSRSKSLGPGGLEALGESSGNAQKAPLMPRSILKPSIPLSPPKPIPPRKSSPSKGIESSPSRASPGKIARSARQSGLDHVPNPFEDASSRGKESDDEARVSLKSEEEQQAAARERERKEAIERRDARRKSLANRRVSFAPEATLHTWDVVELPEDATSSSEATNSTRRASSISNTPASPLRQGSDTSEPPSTPPDGEVLVAASPAQQQDSRKIRRRRSSGIPPMNFNNPEDLSSSPMSSVGSDEGSFMTADDDIIDASDSDSDKDIVEREETINLDNDDTTDHSMALQDSNETQSNDTSQRLDDALRQATEHANTQKIVQDEDGDVSMEMATGEVTYAFKPWAAKVNTQVNLASNSNSQNDQEILNTSNTAEMASNQDDEEATMDVTKAIGGILHSVDQPPQVRRRKSFSVNGRRASVARRRSSIRPDDGEQTMEFTTAIGGIQTDDHEDQNSSSINGDEDMSMEFTAVVGGVINRAKEAAASPKKDDALASQQLLEENRRASLNHQLEDDGMDITAPLGGILTPFTECTEPSEENTNAMDFTAAVGSILPKDLQVDDKSKAKMLMEEEVDHGQLTKSPFLRQNSQDMLKMTPNVKASETGSPSIVGAQTRITRRSAGARQSATPKTDSRQTTPMKKPTTPSKQLTPQPARPITPSKTPPAKNISMRKTSPKRLFKEQMKHQSASPKPQQPTLQFSEDATTGLSMPSVVLTPRTRRASGVGIDQEGIGSPRAAALLDRRASIGDQATKFEPQGAAAGGVRFADPRQLEQELDHDRAEDERRESGRGILEREADGNQDEEKDATTSLRDMIDSMTPRKNKLKGRKSLAIGAAKGLLGKRPVELDDDDEDATPKRLRITDHSPVKSIHLPAPPSKDETTGRLGKAPRFNLGEINANVTTPTTQTFPPEKVSTPKDQGRFKNTEAVRSASKPPVSFNEQLAGVAVEPEQQPDDERIHLQDFLNMTSIRFMELTTTKRRHTIAPNKSGEDSTLPIGEQPKADDDRRLSACVVASASTIPMLELYQHSCRELKKYISEGRSIVREIEADTYEDNPPLFREYMTASPAVRSIMDNQFKNIKTHARLLSKGMWYEWRMKLLDGLKAGLVNIGNGLVDDAETLAEQEKILESVLPPLVEKHEAMSLEASTLQAQIDAIANCDQDELKQARDSLVSVETEIEAKKAQIEALELELSQQEASIEASNQRKATCLREIEEAERVREECRGWTPAEIAFLKGNVDKLEKECGWTISSAQDNTLTLKYRDEVSIYVTPSAFAPHADPKSSNAPISLSYTPQAETAPSTVQRFFLQLLRARLLSVHQAQTPLRQVLDIIQSGWDLCKSIVQQMGFLKAGYPTEASIISDETLHVNAVLLMRDMRTKLDIGFDVSVGGLSENVSSSVGVKARVVYGEELKEGKMDEFLGKRVEGVGAWAEAVAALEERLKARGKKDKSQG